MQLVDMKAAQAEENAENSGPMEAPVYPWGLQLHLSDEVLEALGFDDLSKFALGGSVMLQAKARVCGTSEHEMSDGKTKRMCLDLQITDLGLGKISKPSTPGSALYGEDSST